MNQNFDPRIVGGQQKPQQMHITKKMVENAEDINCINQIPKTDSFGKIVDGEFILCNGEVFVDAYKLKYVSPIMSPVGKPTIGNLMIGKLCIVCGKLFNPDEWLKQKSAHEKAVEGTTLDKKENKDAKTKL